MHIVLWCSRKLHQESSPVSSFLPLSPLAISPFSLTPYPTELPLILTSQVNLSLWKIHCASLIPLLALLPLSIFLLSVLLSSAPSRVVGKMLTGLLSLHLLSWSSGIAHQESDSTRLSVLFWIPRLCCFGFQVVGMESLWVFEDVNRAANSEGQDRKQDAFVDLQGGWRGSCPRC